MVKIRLQRTGRRNHSQWRMVATDQRKKRDGKCIEILGWYDPHRDDSEKINIERYDYWVSKGAQASDVSRQIVNRFRNKPAAVEASVKTETSVKPQAGKAPEKKDPAADEASVKTQTSVQAKDSEAPTGEDPAADEASVKTQTSVQAKDSEAPTGEDPAAEEASVKTKTSVKASAQEAPKSEDPAADEASVKKDD